MAFAVLLHGDRRSLFVALTFVSVARAFQHCGADADGHRGNASARKRTGARAADEGLSSLVRNSSSFGQEGAWDMTPVVEPPEAAAVVAAVVVDDPRMELAESEAAVGRA